VAITSSTTSLRNRSASIRLNSQLPARMPTAVAGTRAPSPRLLEECARFLRVRPGYFREYRATLPRAA